MCLAVPMEVIELLDGNLARVALGGVEKTVGLDLLSDVAVGDFVLIHVGFALSRLDRDEAEETLAMFETMARAKEAAAS